MLCPHFTVKETEALSEGLLIQSWSDAAGFEHRYFLETLALTYTLVCGLRPKALPRELCFPVLLLDQESDSPEGLLVRGETKIMMEVSRASMLLLARHTYSPESSNDIWCSCR